MSVGSSATRQPELSLKEWTKVRDEARKSLRRNLRGMKRLESARKARHAQAKKQFTWIISRLRASTIRLRSCLDLPQRRWICKHMCFRRRRRRWDTSLAKIAIISRQTNSSSSNDNDDDNNNMEAKLPFFAWASLDFVHFIPLIRSAALSFSYGSCWLRLRFRFRLWRLVIRLTCAKSSCLAVLRHVKRCKI